MWLKEPSGETIVTHCRVLSESMDPKHYRPHLFLCLCSLAASLVVPGSGTITLTGEIAGATEAITAGPRSSLILVPDLTPLDTKYLAPAIPPVGIVTSTTISPTELTIPSLWWIAEQIAQDPQYGNKFIQDWIAYAGDRRTPGRVDLVVNRQLWSLQDYMQRFTFISRFSAIARAYGYNIRVFDNQTNLVGAFTCDFRGINLSQLNTAITILSSSTDVPNPSTYTRDALADEITCKTYVDTDTKAGRLEILRPPPREQIRESTPELETPGPSQPQVSPQPESPQ